MTAVDYFIVEWAPSRGLAETRATFETVSDDEAPAALDQFAACMRHARDANNIILAAARCADCGHDRAAHDSEDVDDLGHCTWASGVRVCECSRWRS